MGESRDRVGPRISLGLPRMAFDISYGMLVSESFWYGVGGTVAGWLFGEVLKSSALRETLGTVRATCLPWKLEK